MEDKIVINELLQDEEKPSSDNTVSFFFFFIYIYVMFLIAYFLASF